ncbi:flagellar assembly protein FliH [Sodalis ligni]|jgi:flagellar assembly protein FliH|uniref:flagellar assembly protein FliH n=1 Tax=Sodalis ligni TaxID=2697027 RepID=UPI00193EEAFE|nr:flagellar assembly protein FliH [Sodalis ligni]QWA09067.1 flagellar assembly protein FliH [Sodalis ligni]
MSDAFNHLPWRPWALDDLAQPVLPPVMPSPLDEPATEESAQQAALNEMRKKIQADAQRNGFDEGFKQGRQDGYQAGLRAGQEEGRQQIFQEQQPAVAQLQLLVSEFQHTLDALDSVMAERLAQLALTAARKVLGQAPVGEGTAMLRQIQQLMQQEPMLSGKPQLHVHPSLVPLVEKQLGATLDLHGWRLIPDTDVHPGGCKVTAQEGDLDASLATRWHELCRLAAPGEL